MVIIVSSDRAHFTVFVILNTTITFVATSDIVAQQDHLFSSTTTVVCTSHGNDQELTV